MATIHFKRTGGFAGIPLTADIEPGQLPRELQTIATAGDLTVNSTTPDSFNYVIRVDGASSGLVMTDKDLAASSSYTALIQAMTQLATQQGQYGHR